MDLFKAIIIAIVEGLTEYLPVSSTAHMIFTSSIFGIQEDDYVKMYQVSIQFGAILAVVYLYWKKFFDFSNLKFYLKLAIAIIPAMVLGYLLDEKIEAALGDPVPIAIVLIIGGIFLLFIDKIFTKHTIDDEKEVSFKKAFIIGIYQCLAMMPGVSRSAASIIGGMQQQLTRKAAAEFSFFLAVPTMLAVCVYSVFVKTWDQNGAPQKGYELLMQGDNFMYFVVGSIVAFVVAVIAIKFFIGVLTKYGFKPWGWYRIIVGIILLIYFTQFQ